MVHFLPDLPMGEDRILCCFVIAEIKDFGSTIHWLSFSNQTLPLKKSSQVDQTHAERVRISVDGIVNCEWYPYLLEQN